MTKPDILKTYKCPHGNRSFENVRDPINKDVGGRYCKNNCSLYKKRECIRWFK